MPRCDEAESTTGGSSFQGAAYKSLQPDDFTFEIVVIKSESWSSLECPHVGYYEVEVATRVV